jgi:hypothetical protein
MSVAGFHLIECLDELFVIFGMIELAVLKIHRS